MELTKKCFKCGMDIPFGASKCPYCHEDLTSGYSLSADQRNGLGCMGVGIVILIIGSWIWAAYESGVMTVVLIGFGIFLIPLAWYCFKISKDD